MLLRKLRQPSAVTNDGTVFAPTSISNPTEVSNFLKNNYPKLTAADLATINNLYPKGKAYHGAGPYWRSAADAYGDMRYMCPGIYLSTTYDANKAGGWNYHWDVAPQGNFKDGFGVTHIDEADSIWGAADKQPEAGLNSIIQGYWTSFIRTGDPNKLKLKSAPEWKKMTSDGLQRIHFVNDQTKVAVERVADDLYARCSYLTAIGASIGQ